MACTAANGLTGEAFLDGGTLRPSSDPGTESMVESLCCPTKPETGGTNGYKEVCDFEVLYVYRGLLNG